MPLVAPVPKTRTWPCTSLVTFCTMDAFTASRCWKNVSVRADIKSDRPYSPQRNCHWNRSRRQHYRHTDKFRVPAGTMGDTKWFLEASHVCTHRICNRCKCVEPPEAKRETITYEVWRHYEHEHGYTLLRASRTSDSNGRPPPWTDRRHFSINLGELSCACCIENADVGATAS